MLCLHKFRVFTVTNGGSGLFAVTKETGSVRLIGSLDYESILDPKEYVLKIQAIDGGGKTVNNHTISDIRTLTY